MSPFAKICGMLLLAATTAGAQSPAPSAPSLDSVLKPIPSPTVTKPAAPVKAEAQRPAVKAATAARPRPVQWTGSSRGDRERSQQLIYSPETWAKFWQRLDREAPRKLDPATEMAVVVYLGERPTGGYSVAILDSYEKEGRLVVAYRELAPAPDRMVTQALTTPWAIAVVARSKLPVVLQEIRPTN